MDWHEHPFKDQKWYDDLKASGEMTIQQIASEIDRDYQASAGRAYYTEFNKNMIVHDYFVSPDYKICLSWDFGYHHPACVWWQKDINENSVQFFELMGNDIYLPEFMLVVEYVMGKKLTSNKLNRVKELIAGHKIENVMDITQLPLLRS